jgi:hypothetical protein
VDLPRTYTKLDKELLASLLKNFAAVPMDIEGDAFDSRASVGRRLRNVKGLTGRLWQEFVTGTAPISTRTNLIRNRPLQKWLRNVCDPVIRMFVAAVWIANRRKLNIDLYII